MRFRKFFNESYEKYDKTKEDYKRFGKLYEPRYFYSEFERKVVTAINFFFENINQIKISDDSSGHRGNFEYDIPRHGHIHLKFTYNRLHKPETYILRITYQSSHELPPEELLNSSDTRIGFWFYVLSIEDDGIVNPLGGNAENAWLMYKDLKYSEALHSVGEVIQKTKKIIDDYNSGDGDDEFEEPSPDLPTSPNKKILQPV